MAGRQLIRNVALAFSLVAPGLSAPATATPYGEDDDEPHVVVHARDVYLLRDGEEIDARVVAADLDFARDMRRHHQGAVDMARVYLSDPRGTHPVIRRLAQAIVANQEFEIGVLDNVRRSVEAGPREIGRIGGRRLVALDRGIDGLEHVWEFTRAPPPGPAELWLTRNARLSEFDVQFARPMVKHHQAALPMARTYNSNPQGTNVILRRMNVDILNDQAYEIWLLESLLARYPGDLGRVPEEPRMMEIMERSMEGMGHSGDSHSHGAHR